MKPQTLANAFATALKRNPGTIQPAPVHAEEWMLLRALRNSATSRDQIVQRRLGLFPDAESAS